MKYLIKIFSIVLVIFSLISCDDDNGIGPCVHTYNEAILHITSVRDTLNNIPLTIVKLRNLKINGSTQFGANPLFESYSIVSDDSVFYCNVPFGFGVEEGKYEFIIEAAGYQPKHFTIENVNYSIFEGGCPSFNDGGKRVDLYLN